MDQVCSCTKTRKKLHTIGSKIYIFLFYCSFLIPPEAYPGRIGILTVTTLVLINIFISISENSPPKRGKSLIELWLLSCILFVFSAFAFYAMILLILRFGNSKTILIKKLDKIAIVFMPICFIIFSIMYFNFIIFLKI